MLHKVEIVSAILTDNSEVFDVIAHSKEAQVLFRTESEVAANDLYKLLREFVNGIEISFKAVI